MHAWLHPMHARISSTEPCLALFGISGSQISALVMAQASACPAEMTSSASCGWLMRPATMTGTRITSLILAASGAVEAGGRLMGGTMCTDPPSVAEVPAVTLT